jgi:DNA-binding MarR family transcriptional regulator
MKLDTRGADDPHVIFALIFMLSNQLQTIGDTFFKEVSTKQWFVMLVLEIMDGYAPTLSELAEGVGSSHQNVKQLVLKLEQKGYVQISKDEADARRLRIKPTPKCKEFSKAYDEKSRVFMDQLFSNFPKEDLAATRRVLFSMRDVLEGMGNNYVKE